MGLTQPPPSPNSASAAQLHRELHSAAAQATAKAGRVPILTHLNADTSWLVQLPYPASALPATAPDSGRQGRRRRRKRRVHYNILIDPWLRGPQIDIGSWFSAQWHVTESAWGSIAELEEWIRESEEVLSARGYAGQGKKAGERGRKKGRGNAEEEEDKAKEEREQMIDAVVVSHEYSDHCHRPTLLEVDREVPVFAAKKAAAIIRSWNHFSTVREIPSAGEDAPPPPPSRSTIMDDDDADSDSELPYWIRIDRLTSPASSFVDLHSAILISFESAATTTPTTTTTTTTTIHTSSSSSSSLQDEPTSHLQGILYTPHGIHAELFSSQTKKQKPKIEILALLHGLHEMSIGAWPWRRGTALNLGAYNGLKSARVLKARYWIGTHDEVKRSGGIISYLLSRKVVTVREALEMEREREREREQRQRRRDGDEDGDGDGDEIGSPRFVDLAGGESIALE